MARIPVEDIGVLVLEGPGVSVSSGALQALSGNGASLLVCDQRHLPSGMLLPLAANGLHAERIRHQASASKPLRKNLWSRIVAAKIRNQKTLLPPGPQSKRLSVLERRLRSGDPENLEAQAARIYWSRLFLALPLEESPFRRQRGGPFPNPLLNYGYAVLRAATARALCGAGLHAGIGIHHRNRYSGYPLADDLMEPYRPWVDRAVRRAVEEGCREIDKRGKQTVLEVLGETARTSAGTGPLMVCLERTAASLATAFSLSAKEGRAAGECAKELDLPDLPGSE